MVLTKLFHVRNEDRVLCCLDNLLKKVSLHVTFRLTDGRFTVQTSLKLTICFVPNGGITT